MSPDAAIDTHITATRAQLETTLDQIGDKLNVSKQASALTAKAKSSYEANPVPWIIGATAAAIVIAGTVAWALLSDD